MNTDLVKEMGYIALATRLKRISDKMTHSTRLMYKNLNIDIEPNWYLVLIIIKKQPKSSIMNIAEQLGFTHQSVINITNKMIKRNYLIAFKDDNDKRKTIFELTEKATKTLPKVEEIWNYGKEAIYELLDGDISIIEHLDVLELNLVKSSFGDRIKTKIDNN